MRKGLISFFVMIAFFFAGSLSVFAETYKMAWSHYTGWEFWPLAEHLGILEKHAKKHGVSVELSSPLDYMESINLYTAGEYDACVMTNMDVLTIPAFGGVDSSAVVVGDFSNGNDGIVIITDNTRATVKSLVRHKIMLVELSVSHYLLARALEMEGMREQDVTLLNISDSEIGTAFASGGNGTVAVTWNPILMQVRNVKNAKLLFDSSQIPGEIIDMLVVRTDAPKALKKALTGAWYETLAVVFGRGKTSQEAIAFMAETSGATAAEFKAQLRTTAMFWNARDAAEFTKGEQAKKTMDLVRTFSFEHGLFPGADSKDAVGISFPDGHVLGDASNVKLRFDSSFMETAARGE